MAGRSQPLAVARPGHRRDRCGMPVQVAQPLGRRTVPEGELGRHQPRDEGPARGPIRRMDRGRVDRERHLLLGRIEDAELGGVAAEQLGTVRMPHQAGRHRRHRHRHLARLQIADLHGVARAGEGHLLAVGRPRGRVAGPLQFLGLPAGRPGPRSSTPWGCRSPDAGRPATRRRTWWSGRPRSWAWIQRACWSRRSCRSRRTCQPPCRSPPGPIERTARPAACRPATRPAPRCSGRSRR